MQHLVCVTDPTVEGELEPRGAPLRHGQERPSLLRLPVLHGVRKALEDQGQVSVLHHLEDSANFEPVPSGRQDRLREVVEGS